MKRTGELLKGCSSLFLAYVGITVAFNAAVIPFQAGLEYVMNQPQKQYVATVRERNNVLLLGTHGILACADLQASDGSELHVCDGQSVLDGKLFPNTRMDDMVPGKKYRITVRGSDTLGYTLLDYENVESSLADMVEEE